MLIPDITAKRAELAPDKTAFRDLVSGATLSFRELEDNVSRAAGLLAERGVLAGARVAILCRNRIEFFEILFACAKLGAVLVPLNWRMPAKEIEPLVSEAGPAVLFFGQEDEDVAGQLAVGGMSRVGLDETGADGYVSLRDSAPRLRGRALWPADDTWYFLYTSGTTGKPKAVIQTYGMAIANYVNIRQAMSIGGDDTTLNYLPLFHTAGRHCWKAERIS